FPCARLAARPRPCNTGRRPCDRPRVPSPSVNPHLRSRGRWRNFRSGGRRDHQDGGDPMSAAESDAGVYVSLQGLVALRHRAKGFSFLARQPVASLLAGGHASKLRGRGLDFDEIRKYQFGDDPRTIDWKVTARMRSPYSRVYTEERERPVLFVVDQRIGMF